MFISYVTFNQNAMVYKLEEFSWDGGCVLGGSSEVARSQESTMRPGTFLSYTWTLVQDVLKQEKMILNRKMII